MRQNKQNKQNNIPLFFEDNSENLDHELLLDYFLGWTLRCAQEGNQDEEVRLASKKVLAYILSTNNQITEIKEVEEVRTWKQWNQIDLCAEIILIDEDDKRRKIAILFEDKMYTHLREGQLEKYKKVFDEYYRTAKNGKTDYELMYIVLTCHYEEKELQSDMDEAKEHGFTLLKWHELKTKSGLDEPTGNFMFDEFWFKYFK